MVIRYILILFIAFCQLALAKAPPEVELLAHSNIQTVKQVAPIKLTNIKTDDKPAAFSTIMRLPNEQAIIEPNAKRQKALTVNASNTTFSIASASIELKTDNNSNGYYSLYNLTLDADVQSDTHTVYFQLYYKNQTNDWQYIGNSPTFSITDNQTSDAQVFQISHSGQLASDNYSVEVRLFKYGEADVKATIGADEESTLSNQPFESNELDGGTATQFSFASVNRELLQDLDSDGFHSQFSITFDVNATTGTHELFAIFHMRALGSEQWQQAYISPNFTISDSSNTDTVTITLQASSNIPTNYYDFAIDIYKGNNLQIRATNEDFNALDDLPLEDVPNDTIQSYTLSNITTDLLDDNDSDGLYSKVRFNFDADVNSGEQTVYIVLYINDPTNGFETVATSADFTITSGANNSKAFEFSPTTGFDGGNYPFYILLVESGENNQLTLANPNDFPALNDIPMERVELDVPPEPKISISPTSLKFEQTAAQETTQTTAKALNRTIRFKRADITPKRLKANALSQQFEQFKGKHVLMQFNQPLNRQNRIELAQQGIKVLQYIPDNTYWVTIAATANLTQVKAAGGVLWIGLPEVQHKIAPVLTSNQIPKYLQRHDKLIDVAVTVFKDVNQKQAAIQFAKFNRNKTIQWTSKHTAVIRIKDSQLKALAQLDITHWIEGKNPPKIANNADLSRIINVDPIRQAPLNLSGNNIDVGVWDGGAVQAHSDFGDRLIVQDNVSVNNHATHVAGTIAGNGSIDSAAKGMAPNVNIYSYDWDNDINEMEQMINTIEISNHSYGFITGWYCGNPPCSDSSWEDYGSDNFGYYGSTAASWDNLIKNHQLLVFKSAGNDRDDGPDCPSGPRCDGPYDNIGNQGNSKNLITVCATDDNNQMSDFSSWGPSDDGRIKPDLCANGTSVYSTLPTNSYGSYSGTSMASPGAAGAAAILFEHFVNTHGNNPQAAELKAIMLHTATDLESTGPDYQTGWGLINAEQAAEVISSTQFISDTIEQTSTVDEYKITVSTQTSLKATIVWTDPAGSPSASVALVNNIDLVLIDPDGIEYYPWVLDSANPANPATTGVNSVDNIEQVVVNSPKAGQWTIRVTGHNIGEGPQNYTLVNQEIAPNDNNNKTFTITNTGTGTLEISSISPETSASWLTLSATSASLSANQSTRITVSVDYDKAPSPSSTTRLVINSNDQSNNPFADGVTIDVVLALDENTDTDGDGIPDLTEIANGLDPNDASDALLDPDNDGLNNLAEYQAGTQMNNADSDNDGMPDGFEVQYQLNPLDSNDASLDSDNDGLTNLQEYLYSTNPTDNTDANTDTDGDGFGNLEELARGSDPLDPNSIPLNIESWLDLLMEDNDVSSPPKTGKPSIPEVTPNKPFNPQPPKALKPMKEVAPQNIDKLN